MADQMTTTNTGGIMPDDKVAEAVEALRQAMLDSGEDPGTVEAKLHAVTPNAVNLVGNFADLQRLGGMQVSESGGTADAFVLPPSPSVDLGGGTIAGAGAATTPAPAPAPAPAEDLNALSKAELQDRAATAGVEVSGSATKAEIVAALEG